MRALTIRGQLGGGATPAVEPRPDAAAGETEPSDRALVRASMDGSTRAFEELYRRHSPAAWRVAQAISHNPDDASDAVAEAFTRVFQALPSGRLGVDLAFRPYLLAATRNAAIDGLRKSGRLRPTDEIERFDQQAPGSGPSERLMVGDDRRKMAEAFAALPERWRSVLWMTEVEEMPARDVAKLLGLSANGVAQLAVRARAGLRDRYLQAHVRNHARPACTHTVEHLGAYVGGGLSPRDIAKVDQHVAACTDCRQRLDEVEDISSTLRRIALPLPLGLGAVAFEHFRLNLLSTAAGAARRVLPPATDGLRRAVGAAAGLSAVVIGLGGMAFLGPAVSPSPPGEQPVARPVEVAAAIAPDRAAAATPGPAPTEATTPATTTESPSPDPPLLKVAVPPLPAVSVPPLPVVAVPPLPAVDVPLPPGVPVHVDVAGLVGLRAG